MTKATALRRDERSTSAEPPALVTKDGASARLERCGDAEALTVRDRVGRVIFQYDAASGRGTFLMPEGDLRLCAPRGAIELVAAEGIRAIAGGEVTVASPSAVHLEVDGGSALHLEEGRATLAGQALEVSAGESALALGRTRATASSLHAAVTNAELTFGKVVRSAESVIDQVGNLYQRVAELCDLKAGRLRTLVREGVWVRGRDVTLLAEKDVKVDGEHINLG